MKIISRKPIVNFITLIAILFSFSTYSYTPYTESIIKTALHNEPVAEPTPLVTISGSHVRMITFTNDTSYTTGNKKLSDSVWMTCEPELKNACSEYVKTHRNLTHHQLALWIGQLLGVPPYQIDTFNIVVFDVPVIQAYYGKSFRNIGIFRPCTDPRISKHNDRSSICPEKMNADDPYISSNYKTWYIDNAIASYTLRKEEISHDRYTGYPWTGYGYTYNWNPKAANIDGLSEFVVLQNTPITVLPNPDNLNIAYISPEQYCGVNS